CTGWSPAGSTSTSVSGAPCPAPPGGLPTTTTGSSSSWWTGSTGTRASTPPCTGRPRSSGGATTARRTRRSNTPTTPTAGYPTCTTSAYGRPDRRQPEEVPMTLAEVFQLIVGADTPVAFRAFDGSTAGPADAQ